MFKKIVSVLIIATILCSALSLGINASALVNTEIVYGDADGDGDVDTTDVTTVLRSLAMLEEITDPVIAERCDINNDGYITIYDARQILRSCASLANLQPDGAFKGYEFNGDDTDIGPENAVIIFNALLNKVKTDMPGFTRSETADVVHFNINNITLSGISLGTTAGDISKAIQDMIVRESEPEAVQTSIKGTNCDNAISAETKPYVSNLNANEVLGVKYTVEAEKYIIEIALPNSQLDNVSQTALQDVFNTEDLRENSENILENVFGSTSLNDAVRKEIKNVVLKAEFDKATGNVISYVTSYETDMYIQNSKMGFNGGILSADLSGIEYSTRISVTYSDFQWDDPENATL